MSFFSKNKKVLAIGTGLAALLGLGTYLLMKEDLEEEQKQDSNNKSNKNNNQVDVRISEADKQVKNPEEYQEKLQKLVKNFQIQKDKQNPNCIDMQTIAVILESSIDLAAEQFIQLTISQRLERRALSEEQYEQVVMRQCDEVETMLNKVQEDIIQSLSISQQQFEESLMLIIQRGQHQQLVYLDMAVKQQLKMKLSSNKELDLQKAKEIIKYQNDVIKEQPDYFERILKVIVSNPEMQQKLPQIINVMLCDKVYEKYQIEEEDIVKMLGPYAQTDQEIHQLMQGAEEGMRELLQKVIPQMGGGMGGMGGMEGGMPQMM